MRYWKTRKVYNLIHAISNTEQLPTPYIENGVKLNDVMCRQSISS